MPVAGKTLSEGRSVYPEDTARFAARSGRQGRHDENERELPADVLVGRNAVLEALRAGRGINRILVANGDREGSIAEILSLAKERGLVIQNVERAKIEALSGGQRHQASWPMWLPFPMPNLRIS